MIMDLPVVIPGALGRAGANLVSRQVGGWEDSAGFREAAPPI